jgi:hypothetical protein
MMSPSKRESEADGGSMGGPESAEEHPYSSHGLLAPETDRGSAKLSNTNSSLSFGSYCSRYCGCSNHLQINEQRELKMAQ